MLASSITAAAAATTAYFSPALCRAVQVRRLRRRLAERRMLALTYDDGPSATVTPRIVDVLSAYDARATFFMLGRNAERNPKVADAVAGAGHEIGCHSDQHVNAWKASPWKATRDIAAGYRKLARWVPPAGMFRPPYGKMTLPTYWVLRRRNADVWWWTIDSGDSHPVLPSPEMIADRVTADGGGVILMHDLARSEERDSFVIETTKLLLKCAQREGMRVRTMTEIGEAVRGVDA